MAAQIVFFVRPFFNQMKKLIAIIIIASGITAVFADTSTNGVVQEKKSPWESNASLGFTLTRGNSDTSLFTAKVLTARKDIYNEWLLGADGAYGENSGVENADSGIISSRKSSTVICVWTDSTTALPTLNIASPSVLVPVIIS